MTDVAPTQASLGNVRTGVIRNAVQENVQVNTLGIIPPFSFQPPGGTSGWKRVRITNYTPYLFQVIGIPGGGSGDPPQLLQPYQQNVWNYVASRGTITLIAAVEGSPLAIPPLRFAYEVGSASGELLFNYVSVEWTDTPDLFFGYYPVPLVGIDIGARADQALIGPAVIPVGTTPVKVLQAFNVYVANSASHNISVVDKATNMVIATVDTVFPPTDLAYDPTNGNLYVARSGTHLVQIIRNNIVIGTVDVGADQTGITVDQVTRKKYVSLAGGNLVAVLSALDVHTGNIAVGNGPAGIDANSATGQVYVANQTDSTVTQIDEATDLVVGIPIVVGNTPVDVEVDTARNHIYVANKVGNTITDINGATALVAGTVAVGNTPVGIDIDVINARVYVANQGSNSVSVVDGLLNVVINTLAPGVGPTDVAIDPVTALLYVTIAANALVVLNG